MGANTFCAMGIQNFYYWYYYYNTYMRQYSTSRSMRLRFRRPSACNIHRLDGQYGTHLVSNPVRMINCLGDRSSDAPYRNLHRRWRPSSAAFWGHQTKRALSWQTSDSLYRQQLDLAQAISKRQCSICAKDKYVVSACCWRSIKENDKDG
jgi:hypothetical protein